MWYRVWRVTVLGGKAVYLLGGDEALADEA